MKKITLLSVLLAFAMLVNAQVADITPNGIQGNNVQTKSTNAWVLDFSYDVSTVSAGQAGVETDGTYFYTALWASDTIVRYDMSGNLVAKFQVAGVTGLRDLAYDGTHFYGGNSGSDIYQMDFTPGAEVLVSTIAATGTQVRAISYDAASTGFWVNNWATDIWLVDMSGAIISTITGHGLTDLYGSAYDDVTVGGPYLWMFDQAGNGLNMSQLNIATQTLTGLAYDATPDLPTGASAGGAFVANIGGKNILGGLNQGEHHIFGYDLDLLFVADDISVIDITAPNNNSGCSLTASEIVTVVVGNVGTSDITTDFDVSYILNGATAVSTTVSASTTTFTAGTTINVDFPAIDLSAVNTYEFKAYSALTGDPIATNDTLDSYTVINNSGTVDIQLTTDGYASETSWELVEILTSSVVASGAGYANNSTIDITACVDAAECYTFYLYDSYGDGGSAATVTFNSTLVGSVALAATSFGDSLLGVGTCAINIDNYQTSNDFNVYPNPTTGLLNITNAENAQVNVYNMIGEVVATATNVSTMDISNLENGTYIVKVISNNSTSTKKITLVK